MTPLLLALVLSGAPPEPKAPSSAEARAKAKVLPFKKALKEKLMGALQISPEAAVDVCAKEAPALAKAASGDGVTVGRSALKLRSEKNAAAPWLTKAMQDFEKGPRGVEQAVVVALPGGKTAYVEPLWTAAPCVVCHGEQLAPGVEKKLKAHYPKDAARGFKLGDLRGVVYAVVDAEAPPRP